jgi:hypothetical protein
MLLWIGMLLSNVASAASPYEMKGVVLLQPESIIQERISVTALAPYIRSVNAAAANVLATRKHPPTGGFLVLAVRPGNQSAMWLDLQPALAPDLAKALTARLRAVPAPTVQTGPVVFAIHASLWGGISPDGKMPAPEEWTQAARKAGKPVETGEVVELIWPR